MKQQDSPQDADVSAEGQGVDELSTFGERHTATYEHDNFVFSGILSPSPQDIRQKEYAPDVAFGAEWQQQSTHSSSAEQDIGLLYVEVPAAKRSTGHVAEASAESIPKCAKAEYCEKFAETFPEIELAEADKALKNAMSSTLGHAALEEIFRDLFQKFHYQIDVEPARAEMCDRLYGEHYLKQVMSLTTGHAALDEAIEKVAHLRIDLQLARAESSKRAAAEKAAEKAAAETKEKRRKLAAERRISERNVQELRLEQERRFSEEGQHVEDAPSSRSEMLVCHVEQGANVSGVEACQHAMARDDDEGEQLLTNFLGQFIAQPPGLDEDQRCCWEWLVSLDNAQGVLRQYWEKLLQEFDGHLKQVMAVRIQRLPGTSVLDGVDPIFFEVLGVERLEHKLLFASGIAEL